MNIHALMRELSGPRPLCRVVDIVSKPLIWNQINTVYSLEFRERCESFRHEVLAGTGSSNGSQGSASTTHMCVVFEFVERRSTRRRGSRDRRRS